jgi:hypothetical protein
MIDRLGRSIALSDSRPTKGIVLSSSKRLPRRTSGHACRLSSPGDRGRSPSPRRSGGIVRPPTRSPLCQRTACPQVLVAQRLSYVSCDATESTVRPIAAHQQRPSRTRRGVLIPLLALDVRRRAIADGSRNLCVIHTLKCARTTSSVNSSIAPPATHRPFSRIRNALATRRANGSFCSTRSTVTPTS